MPDLEVRTKLHEKIEKMSEFAAVAEECRQLLNEPVEDGRKNGWTHCTTEMVQGVLESTGKIARGIGGILAEAHKYTNARTQQSYSQFRSDNDN